MKDDYVMKVLIHTISLYKLSTGIHLAGGQD